MTTPPLRDASDAEYTTKPRENRKGGLDPGDRGGSREKKNNDKSSLRVNTGGVRSDDEGNIRDKRKEGRSIDERRPKREREELPEKKEKRRERRFREVKERESPRERDSSRERSWRPSSYRGRSVGEERFKSHREHDQDKGSMRGGQRGRRFFNGGSRQGGAFLGNQGRYNSGGERDSRQGNWGGDRYNGGNMDSSYRRQPMSHQVRDDKWQHDLFETVVTDDNNEPDEDPIAKIEALLAS